MQLTDILNESGGAQSIARELGVDENEVHSGAAALTPAILGGFQQHAQQPGGVDRLGGVLGQLGGGSLLDNVVSSEPTDVGRGNNLLGHLFGSKEASSSIAENAARQSGVDASVLKRMLPMLAMMAAGHMSRQQGGLGSVLGALAGGGGGLAGLAGMLGGRRQ